MFELLGIVFGGVSRLTQQFMEARDKQHEREHEAIMFEKQVQLQAQKITAERDLRQMDVEAQRDTGELNALVTAIQAQASEAKAAGGWVAKLSASVRPVVSYWLLFIYTSAKFASLYLTLHTGDAGALAQGEAIAEAIKGVYTPFDGALLGSIVSYWFADRSLRKAGK
ncbi:MAG TPA: hypothetical protein VE034_02725 [Burkholderiales bacterium]|nr:hypothetical protein [Burkholderiales bacterium]